jgi:DNA-binding NtrC family response regulator
METFTEAGARRVLVVEDDVLVRMAITEMLEVAGMATAEAATAEAALDILSTGPSCHAVVSDVSLPGLSGVELAGAVRARWPSMRIILVSGHERVAVPESAAPVSFLAKPFQFEDLLKAVEG